MATPTLQTARLVLSPFSRSDAGDVFAYASKPNVSKFTTWQTHQTIADSEAFIDMVLRRGPADHTWAIRLQADPRVVGAIEFGFKPPDRAEFHYVLAELLWNRGLMTEAARAVVAWGLDAYPAVRRLTTSAVAENIGSQRVMEKCGLQFDREFDEHWAKFPNPVRLREHAWTRPPA